MFKHLRLLVLAALCAVFVGIPHGDATASSNFVRVTIPYSSFSAAATSKAVTVYKLPQGQNWVVSKVIVQPNTAFSGGAVSAATLTVGKSGSADRYVTSTNVFTGAGVGFANSVLSTAPGVEAGGNIITATLTTTSANTSALTAGSVTIMLEISATPMGN